MAQVVEGQPGKVSLLSQHRISNITKERIELGTYAKPAIEVDEGDLMVINANGETVIAVVSGVFDSHLELSSMLYIVNSILKDGSLGRDRQIRKSKAGFVECFMADFEPEWSDIEYSEL